MRLHTVSLAVGLLLCICLPPTAPGEEPLQSAPPATAQDLNIPMRRTHPATGTGTGAQSPLPPPEDETTARMEKEMAKKANEARQAVLKRDTEQLFKMATELKQYVDKSNENILSVDVVKKADEIEKLAHNVKEKMRGSD